MNYPKRNYLITLVISSCILLMGFTYNDIPVDKENKKKLEKAQKLNSTAQELIDKASSMYSEIANYDNSNPKNYKKSESLKKKALDIQLNALEKQKEANFLEYSILIKVAPALKEEYLKTHEKSTKLGLYEEHIEELFFKAEKLRNDAYKLGKEEKQSCYEKLLEAQGDEKSGLDKKKQLIDIYIGNVVLEDESQESSKMDADKNVEINDELLQVYMDYMEHPITSSRIETFKDLRNSDSLNSANLRNTWEKTLYEEPIYLAENELIQDSSLAQTTNIQEVDTKVEETRDNINKEETKKITIFKINIAADKNPLSQSVLRKIHDDNKNLNIIKEDGWDQYSIGDFKSFEEAEKFKKKIGISEAFVMGVEDNVRVNITSLETEIEKPNTQSKNEILEMPDGFIFKVQIAASRNMLSDDVLQSFYSGNEKIDVSQEEGWFKYSVGSYNSFEQAANLKKAVEAQGAFIVAYHNGVKTPLYLARKRKVLQVSPKENIVFKVQIAADTKALSSEVLHKLYSGYENIKRYDENGWNKYAIGEFNTFNEANEFRKSCKVKGAFVIAFRGNEKLNVLEAKKMKHYADPTIITDWIANNEQVVFRVQIAASSNEMSVNQIKNIYCFEPKVYLSKVAGWFKYSIGNFNRYQSAIGLKKDSGVKGAFVVAYKNGEKLSLTRALKMSK